MINFNNTMLKNFLHENRDFLVNSRIQKIQQPNRKEFIITLRNNAQTKKLYINIDPSFYHICFMSQENEEKRALTIPQKPPMFCMLLRKYLTGAKIAKVNQPEYERIFEIYTEITNEFSEKIYLCLAIELMGKHSNIILYNHDTNIIIGSAHNVGSDKSKEREILGGLPYTYPIKNNSSWFKNENIDIDTYYAEEIYKSKFNSQKEKFKQITNKKIKKINSSLKKISENNATKEKINAYRLYGDLIMANLHNNKDFLKEITVYNYENNCNTTIQLDDKLTLKDNAKRFYKLYNKYKKANIKSQELINELNIEKEYNEQLLYAIETSESISDLEEILPEIETEKSKNTKKEINIKTIKTNTYTIWIGKNNKQNDYLISKIAKDEDIWFHTKNCAGSHVLLRTTTFTDELLLKCATLAKEHSQGATSTKIGVIYTQAKYIKKPSKANLGYVTYSNEKEIIID